MDQPSLIDRVTALEREMDKLKQLLETRAVTLPPQGGGRVTSGLHLIPNNKGLIESLVSEVLAPVSRVEIDVHIYQANGRVHFKEPSRLSIGIIINFTKEPPMVDVRQSPHLELFQLRLNGAWNAVEKNEANDKEIKRMLRFIKEVE